MAGGEFAGIDLAVMLETACLRGNRKVERKTIMKKLMFAAVVAAAGLMYGLESSNTVGYQQYALDTSNPDDYVHNIGVQFKNTGATESYTITTSIFGVDLEKVGLSEVIIDYFMELISGTGAVRKTLQKYC